MRFRGGPQDFTRSSERSRGRADGGGLLRGRADGWEKDGERSQKWVHEHLLEHLSLEEGYRLACESYRVLRPTGVLRIGVPDCGAPHIAWPDAPTRLLALQEFFAEAGHRTMYDTETLSLVLKAAGFPTVEQRPFGDSRLEPAPDGEHRRIGSLYVEAVK